MEELSYFFNGDFEQKLFSSNQKDFQSNKMSQEFEYFIHLLRPQSQIYTRKTYDDSYQSWIEKLTGEKIKTTQCRDHVKFWCGNFDDLELTRKLQEKSRLAKFLIENDYFKHEIQFINDYSQLKENKLYKYSKSLSGGGHYFFPRDDKRLQKLLSQGEVLVEEDILNRVLDFSALFEGPELLCLYENEIDERFQYKGTWIGSDLDWNGLKDEYRDFLNQLKSFIEDYSGVYSVDSFFYERSGNLELYPASEINARKTMGYVAFKLKDIYFKDTPVLKMKLFKNHGKQFDYEQLYEVYNKKVLLISPLDNMFLTFIFLGDDKEEVKKLENDLLTRFF